MQIVRIELIDTDDDKFDTVSMKMDRECFDDMSITSSNPTRSIMRALDELMEDYKDSDDYVASNDNLKKGGN